MIKAERIAVVVVDPYNDFLSTRGIAWPLVKNVVSSTAVIENIASIITLARQSGCTVAYAPHHRYRKTSFRDRKYLHPANIAQRQSKIFSVGEVGSEFLPDLQPEDGDIIASEHLCSSGFVDTDLHGLLQAAGSTHLVIVGMITNTCVEATARSAVDLGYHVTLVEDAVAAFSPYEHEAAIRENYPLIAHVVTTTAKLLKTFEA